MAIPKSTSQRISDDGSLISEEEYALQQLKTPEPDPTRNPTNTGGNKGARPKDDPSYDSEYDIEKGVLKPFGSSRAPKRKASTNHFDPRKNTNRRNFLIRTGTITVLTGVILVGAYNAMFPPEVPTEQQIAAIAKKSTNNTKFPRGRARMFVENYMTSYVRVNADQESAKLLGYYTSGDEKNDTGSTARTSSGAVTQYDVVSVKSDDGVAINDNSASFLVTTYVKPSVNTGNNALNKNDTTSPSSSDKKTEEGKWLSFRVSVFWDEKTNGFAIAGDPTVLPGMNIISSENIPQARSLGQADTGITKEVEPVVSGYMKAYAASTPTDTSALQQYVVPGAKSSLLTGFGGKLSFGTNTSSGSGSGSNSGLTMTAYVPEGASSDDATTVKVKTTVDWVDTVEGKTGDGSSQPRITYKSTYVLTLQKQGNGKWLVSEMLPDVYIPDADALKDYQKRQS